jgi:hypothetical protein
MLGVMTYNLLLHILPFIDIIVAYDPNFIYPTFLFFANGFYYVSLFVNVIFFGILLLVR